MKLELDFSSSKSIYLQIEDNLIKSIAKGELKIGESLPSVRSMAEDIGVNLHTVNKAYKSIYLQIEDNLIKSIAKGELKIGESLPSVRSMAEDIGVNLHTVNKAYNELKDRGYLNIDRRKGAVVADLPMEKNEIKEKELFNELEILISNSFLSGIQKDEFLKLAEKIYNECEVVKND